MFFILQKEEKYDFNDVEFLIIKKLLDSERYLHEYTFLKLSDFYDEERDENGLLISKNLVSEDIFPKAYKTGIPIGTIEFVETWLKIFHGINHEEPIEIPPILRTDEFLKRKYSIVPASKIPRKGNYFIKNASRLKDFSYCGDLEWFLNEKMFEPSKTKYDSSLKINKDDLYQVSEIVKILAEYRVYIIGGKIESIDFYDGNPLFFPDANLIMKANNLYSTQSDYPKSYSMDVMVTDKGTAIIEIHNFTSLGLYSTIWGTNLLYAYVDGIDYLLKHNTKQTEFSNF